jgi:transcriptional regulator with PAS, ATPase and Fis domain
LSKEKIIGKSINDLMHEIDDLEIKNLFINSIHVDKKILAGIEQKSIMTCDVTNNIYKLFKSPLTDLDNSVIGLTTIIVDITDDVRTSKNKVCMQCSMNIAMNSQEKPSIILDSTNNIIFVNTAFCDLVGLPETYVLDKNVKSIMLNYANLEYDRKTKFNGVISVNGKIVKIALTPLIDHTGDTTFVFCNLDASL